MIPPRLALTAAAAALGWAYWPTALELLDKWLHDPQYSHGLLVPPFCLYLLWRKPPSDRPAVPRPVAGLAVLAVALAAHGLAAFTSFLTLDGLSFVVALAGLALLHGGRNAVGRSWHALVFSLFMIPLPYAVERMAGAELQHVATVASALLLQCFGQPAVTEGNLILIEDVKLGVVEACSGLRMLATFVAFCVGAAMVMERHWLVKGLVLLSAAPIAVATNVLRIAATGLAHVWLKGSDSKGPVLDFIHDFNGWMMMPVGLAMLLAELWVLKHLLVEKPLQKAATAKAFRPAFA